VLRGPQGNGNVRILGERGGGYPADLKTIQFYMTTDELKREVARSSSEQRKLDFLFITSTIHDRFQAQPTHSHITQKIPHSKGDSSLILVHQEIEAKRERQQYPGVRVLLDPYAISNKAKKNGKPDAQSPDVRRYAWLRK
jgi:hypothetical protein